MNLEKIEGLIKLVEASSLTQFTYLSLIHI